MLNKLHSKKRTQLFIGFLIGIGFGFLLQKGGVTQYNVIMQQLLLEDFTVVKIMLTAVLTGMIGVHLLRSLGFAQLHPKPGSLGASVIGGLVFGIGFGLLGYCPGTVAGAFAQGALDALLGGIVGILIGAGLFAALYPKLEKHILHKGDFGSKTFPELLKVNSWIVVAAASAMIVGLLIWIESAGL